MYNKLYLIAVFFIERYVFVLVYLNLYANNTLQRNTNVRKYDYLETRITKMMERNFKEEIAKEVKNLYIYSTQYRKQY